MGDDEVQRVADDWRQRGKAEYLDEVTKEEGAVSGMPGIASEEDSEGETEAAFQVFNEYVHIMPEEEAEAEAHHQFEAATTGSAAASWTEAEEAEAEAARAQDTRRLDRAFDTLTNEALANGQLVLTEDPPTSGSDSVPWFRDLASSAMEDGMIKPQSREELGNLCSRTGGPGYDVPDPKSPIRIAFCQTCLNRGFQLKLSLSVNLAVAWKYRSKCTFFLVVFNENSADSQNLLAWISTNLKPALDARFLRVATGDMKFLSLIHI